MSIGRAAAPRSRFRWVVLGVTFGAQCVVLYAPGTHGPTTTLPLDKITHFGIFAVVGAAAVWAGVPWRWAMVLLLAQAGVSEVVQEMALPGRGAELGDLVADLAGTAVGVSAGQALVGRQQPA